MSTNKSSSNDMIETMGEWFAKFPALPKGGREGIVRVSPWLAVIFGILGILVGIAGLGVLTVLSPFALMGGAGANYGTGLIAALIYLVGSVVLLASFPGLQAHKYSGWKLLFWSVTVHLVGGLVSLSIVSTIIWALIEYYLIFQIRSYYK